LAFAALLGLPISSLALHKASGVSWWLAQSSFQSEFFTGFTFGSIDGMILQKTLGGVS
jgi:hypothetical protein